MIILFSGTWLILYSCIPFSGCTDNRFGSCTRMHRFDKRFLYLCSTRQYQNRSCTVDDGCDASTQTRELYCTCVIAQTNIVKVNAPNREVVRQFFFFQTFHLKHDYCTFYYTCSIWLLIFTVSFRRQFIILLDPRRCLLELQNWKYPWNEIPVNFNVNKKNITERNALR